MDKFAAIKIGDTAEIEHTITQADLDTFVRLTGDDNPLHIDEDYSAQTAFQAPVVHGMLTASFISTVIGKKLPGEGALWCEQNLKFLLPVRIDEKIRVCVRVKAKSNAVKMLTLETNVYSANHNLIIEGEAKVKIIESEQEQKVMDPSERGAVIVTGAGKGIGSAIALELAKVGYPVVINYRHSKKAAEKIKAQIKEMGGKSLLVKADVTQASEIDSMLAQTIKEFGKIYGIVNNASPPINPCSFENLTWEDIQLHIDTQVKGAFNLSKACVPHFLENGNGCIVNIGSTASDNSPPMHWTAYTLAKSALNSFSKSLALELGPKHIRVNLVSPGMTHTDMSLHFPDSLKTMVKLQTPIRKLARPIEIANVVTFLLSEKASHVAGENIRVCGGATMI